MVLVVMIASLLAICIMGYLYMRSVEAIVKTINLYPEATVEQEEEPSDIGEIRVLPTANRSASVLPTDFELWYQEQQILRETDPESPLIDSDWDRHSVERQALNGGVEW